MVFSISMKQTTTGTYFLINETIIYNLDTQDERAMDHVELWPKVIHKLLSTMSFTDRQDLILNAAYGADRGRVVMNEGIYRLYGTPGSERFKDELLSIFGLDLTSQPFKCDFKTDLHYRVITNEKSALCFMLKLHKIELQPGSICLPGLKRLIKQL